MDCTPQTINLTITSNDSNVSGKTLDLYPVEVFILIGSRDLNMWRIQVGWDQPVEDGSMSCFERNRSITIGVAYTITH